MPTYPFRLTSTLLTAVVIIGLVAAIAGCGPSTPPEPKNVPGYYPQINVQRKQAERQAAANQSRQANTNQ